MGILRRMFGARAQYLMICAGGDEVKAKSKRLGIQSIILAVIGLALVVVCVVIGTLIARNVQATVIGKIDNLPIMSFFGTIVFYCFALASFLTCSLSSTTFALYQRRVNKLKIGTVSLA